MSETRKLVAILVADIVGYSRLAGADEDRTLARLRALRSDLIDPTTAVLAHLDPCTSFDGLISSTRHSSAGIPSACGSELISPAFFLESISSQSLRPAIGIRKSTSRGMPIASGGIGPIRFVVVLGLHAEANLSGDADRFRAHSCFKFQEICGLKQNPFPAFPTVHDHREKFRDA